MLDEALYQEIRQKFIDFARQEFLAIQARYANDGIYFMGILETQGAIGILFRTEKGLIKAATDGTEKGYFSDIEEALRKQRWAAHYGDVTLLPESLEKMRQEFVGDFSLEDNGEGWLEACNRMGDLAEETLRILESEGVFGQGKVREQWVVYIPEFGYGDGSYANETLLREINPPVVVERLLRELEASK